MSFTHSHDGVPCADHVCALPRDSLTEMMNALNAADDLLPPTQPRGQHRMMTASDHSHDGVACTRVPFWSCGDPRAKEQPVAQDDGFVSVRQRIVEDDARFPKTPLMAGERLPGDHTLPLAVVFNGSTGNLTLVCMMLRGVRGCQRTYAIDRIQEAVDHVLDEHNG